MASLYVILTHPPFHLHRCHTHTHTQDRLDLFIIIYDASLHEMPSFFNRQAIRSSHKHFSLVLFVDIVIAYLPLWGFRSLFRTVNDRVLFMSDKRRTFGMEEEKMVPAIWT